MKLIPFPPVRLHCSVAAMSVGCRGGCLRSMVSAPLFSGSRNAALLLSALLGGGEGGGVIALLVNKTLNQIKLFI